LWLDRRRSIAPSHD